MASVSVIGALMNTLMSRKKLKGKKRLAGFKPRIMHVVA